MKYAIALDIGGTKIEGVLFDRNYRAVDKKRVYYAKKTSDSSVKMPKKQALDMICSVIESLKTGIKQSDIAGIGISIPDVISKKGSIVGTSKISSLSNFSLADYLEKKYRTKVRAANDADCFSLAEQRLGAGKGHDNVVGVIYGTGIGAGIIINSKIYSGATGSAGEFGHNIVNPAGPKERLGFRGTIEAYAGGPDVVRNYLGFGGKNKNAGPKEIFASKEPAAKKARNNALVYFSIGLAQIMNMLNPGVIVLGGGQSNLSVYKELNCLTKKYTIDGLRKNIRIVKNKLGDSGGVYGAAVLAFEG